MVLLLLLVQEEIIRNNARNAYEPACKKCAEGLSILESEPGRALQKLTEAVDLVEKNRLKAVERSLKIEDGLGGYTEVYRFFPYQLRGRARMALARKEPADAKAHLKFAVLDFEKSLEFRCEESRKWLNQAREELGRKDPRAQLESDWKRLLEEKKFRSARSLIETHGANLGADRAKWLTETEEACRRHVQQALSEFGEGPTLASLAKIDLDRRYQLPKEEELIGEHPLLPWCRSQREFLGLLKKDPAQPGLDTAAVSQMLGARSLGEAVRNPWFRVAADLAHGWFESRMKFMLAQTVSVSLAERRKFRGDAGKLLASWRAARDRSGPEFAEHHPVLKNPLLSTLATSFPVDPIELDDLNIEGSFTAESPEAYLGNLEIKLRSLWRTPNLSEESAIKTLSLLIAAVAIRELLAGRTEGEVAAKLKAEGADLKKLGGTPYVRRWGKRVERIFSVLLQ